MSLREVHRRFAKFGVILFAALVATAGLSGEASARHRKHAVHHRLLGRTAQNAQTSLNVTAHLGPLQYFGGSKSPMWRERR